MNINVAKGYAHLAKQHLVRTGKVVRRFPVEIQGKKYLKQLLKTSKSNLRIDEHSGWTRLDKQIVSQMKDGHARLATLSKLQKLAKKWLGEADERCSSNQFPYNIMLSSDLLEHPDILEFALDSEFLVPANIYLGQVPRLTNISLTWAPKDQKITGSRLFHYDHRDTRQVKLFMNLCDIGEDDGPVCFLPADQCSLFNARFGYNQKKNDDDIVYSICSRDTLVINVGEVGTGVLVDTGRCLHYGSRMSKTDRLMLMVSYVLPNCVLTGKNSRVLDSIRQKLAQELFENDPVRKYALTIQAI